MNKPVSTSPQSNGQSRPEVSVILAFRNPGLDFRLAIQSVFAQSFADWELLLLDDGSKDGSLELARGISDSRVRVFSDGLSLGLSRRLNELIDLARAPYIARMDADDIMHPDRLQTQYDLLARSPSDTVLGTAAYVIDEQSRVLGIRYGRSIQKTGLAAAGSFIHPTVAASSEWFRRYRYSEDPSFYRSEDAELWARSSSHSRFINLPEPLLFYRETGAISVPKYAGSTVGSIVLGTRRAGQSRIKSSVFITTKLLKLQLVCMADIFGFKSLVPLRQFTAISTAQSATASQVMVSIKNTVLPLRGGSHSAQSAQCVAFGNPA